MTPSTQAISARENTALRLKKKLLERKLTVTALAALIGRPRETVSRTIHGEDFPRVLREIEEALA